MLQRLRKSRTMKMVVLMMVFMMLLPLQFPMVAYALNSGPTPPEYSTFQKVSSGEMVDPFTGNVQYSVPLFEIGGYPISLNYSGDINSEQDAGWVGLGWSLQAGSIGRATRGLPDDFKGEDIKKDVTIKPHHTTVIDFQKMQDGKQVELLGLNGGASIPGFPKLIIDNYRGFGIDYDLNRSFKMPKQIDSSFVKYVIKEGKISHNVWGIVTDSFIETVKVKPPLLDFNTNYNSFDGNSYSVVPQFGFIQKVNQSLADSKWLGGILNTLRFTPSMQFNSQSGIQSLGLGMFDVNKSFSESKKHTANFAHRFLAPAHIPMFNPNAKVSVWNTQLEFSNDQVFIDGRSLMLNVTVSSESLQENQVTKKGYGCLYMEEGSKVNNALTDQQNAQVGFDKYSEMLPSTVTAYDVFNISASGVGGSFHLKFNSLGMISPPVQSVNTNPNKTIHAELGLGTTTELGGNLGLSFVHKQSGEWIHQNDMSKYLGFKGIEANDPYEPTSMRNDFEFIESQNDYNQKMGGYKATKVGLKKGLIDISGLNKYSDGMSAQKASSSFYDINRNETPVSSQIVQSDRVARQQSITYLTADQATLVGIQKEIHNYHYTNTTVECMTAYDPTVTELNGKHVFDHDLIARTKSYRLGHHISEINVQQPSGMTYNFGLPVYQAATMEVTFAVDGTDDPNKSTNYLNGKTGYEGSSVGMSNDKGIDNFYQKTTTPAYATTYLLTNILSADYSDLTQDGPSPDDIGSYVKFNYGMPDYQSSIDFHDDPNSELDNANDPLHHLFEWRAPYDSANWARNFKSDELDDRASFSFGIREQWYMHSIETKDQIAIFQIADRADGYASNPVSGQQDINANSQKHLVGIKIYNKRDFDKNGLSAEVVREIKLHYSYDLCNGVPSYGAPSVSGTCNDHPLKNYDVTTYGTSDRYSGGKLTLNKVEFIEGSLGMASQNPYVFEYKTLNPDYDYKSVDRWGVYTPINSYHETVSSWDQQTLEDYPYSQQEKGLRDQWASAWMLSDITVPSGGHLHLDYESDDYAYVQDREALNMIKVVGLRKELEGVSTNELYSMPSTLPQKTKDLLNYVNRPHKYITFELDPGKTPDDYLQGLDLVYFSFNIDLAQQFEDPAYEQVSGFFTVEEYGNVPSSSLGYIKVTEYDLGKTRAAKVHPATKMGFQFAFSNLPHLMNPKGHTNRSSGKEALEDGINQIVGIVPEYIKSIKGESAYYQGLGHAQRVKLSKSYLRLKSPRRLKLGGGHRVKKVTTTDNWSDMTSGDEPLSTYSTLYTYTTLDEATEQEMSSGVAIYEPFVGGDENPFKMPINLAAIEDIYIKKRGGPIGPVTLSYEMGPIGEEFYPSAGVGYSKITVQNEKPNQNIVRHSSGRTEYEFYTAKDFPTKSSMTTLDKEIRKFSSGNLGFEGETDTSDRNLNQTMTNGTVPPAPDDRSKKKKYEYGLDVSVHIGFAAASQGYIVERNDMHGKPKSVKTFKDNVTSPVTSTTYFYKTTPDDRLLNQVTVMRDDGTFETTEMGVQMIPTLFSLRTTEVNQEGSIQPNVNWGGPVLVTSIFGGYNLYSNDSRIMVMTKQVFRNGILDRVETISQGASSYTKNLAWDPVTGKVLLQETKDEFDDKVYSLSKPAYWMNSSLSGAYNNIGAVIDLTLNGSDIEDPSGLLHVGDVLVRNDFVSNEKYWVLDVLGGNVSLIKHDGTAVSGSEATANTLKVFKSGHRNLLHFAGESVTMKSNPLINGRWDNYDKVISAATIDYHDTRQMMYLFDYCYGADCSDPSPPVLETSSDLTTFGYGYSNQPSSYSADYNWTYENLEFGADPSSYYGKPTYCDCGENGGGSFQGTGTPSCNLCSREGVYTPSVSINPFVYGINGIWRPASEMVYFEKRNESAQRTQTNIGGNPNTTDIRNDGYLQNYIPYWTYNNKWERNALQDTTNPWTWKDSITKTDFFGNDLESVSALNQIKNAVLYDYERKIPVAVASNAAYHEVLFDGFEDYSTDAYVSLNCVNDTTYTINTEQKWEEEICDRYRHWKMGEALIGGTNRISSQQAHTGNHSLMLGDGSTSISLLNRDTGQVSSSRPALMPTYTLQEVDFVPNFYLNPTTSSDYIISMWVKEGYDGQFDFDLISTSSTLIKQLETATVSVNGWRKLTYRFTLNGSEQLAALKLISYKRTGVVSIPCYVDDLMIMPARSVMSAFVYDRDKKRLMAELSPNNYATYYEYDKQGNMIRQKVETDRGIMTLGESRQSIRK